MRCMRARSIPALDAARPSCYIIGTEEFGMKYRVLIEQDEDGIHVTEVPSLPGCISQGQTRAEALDNIKEAMLRLRRFIGKL